MKSSAFEIRPAEAQARSARSASPTVRPGTHSSSSHPDGTFFHLAEWQDVLHRAFGHRTHYLLAERGGEISGVLPLAEVKSLLFGHALVSTPFCVYGGILAADRVREALLSKKRLRPGAEPRRGPPRDA